MHTLEFKSMMFSGMATKVGQTNFETFSSQTDTFERLHQFKRIVIIQIEAFLR